VRLIVWCEAASIRSNPTRPSWLPGTVRRLQSRIGTPGLCAASAAAGGADMVVRVKCARSPLLPSRIMSPQTSERIYPEPL
jgi:hypothetical protein